MNNMESASVREIVKSLNAAKVRYLVVGGLAVAAHDYLRYTVDVDLVVALDPENISRALAVLGSLGFKPRVPVPASDFADAEKRESWIREKGMVVFQMTSEQHKHTPLDLFVTEPFDFDLEWSRAEWKPVMGSESAPVLSLVELIAMKKKAGRDKDMIDVAFLEKVAKVKQDERGDPK